MRLVLLPLFSIVAFAQTIVVGTNGLTSLNFNGTEYGYVYGEKLITRIDYEDGPSGVPSCQSTVDGWSVTQSCRLNGLTSTFRANYRIDNEKQTVYADLKFQNDSDRVVRQVMYSPMGLQFSEFGRASSRTLHVGQANPLSWIVMGDTRAFLFLGNYRDEARLNVTCGWLFVCKLQPTVNGVNPGNEDTMTVGLRFSTDAGARPVDLLPEVYESYRASYPPTLNWPDRRPLMAWFMADYGKRSERNPRGYLQDAAFDVFQATASDRLVRQAEAVVRSIQSRPVQPQGVILWDLEGQEFRHATTYIGDPTALAAGYAPEINAAADEIFRLFRDAGYKVGVTLRPQVLQFGPASAMPATCNFDPSGDYKDYFIRTDAPWRQAFYGCFGGWGLVPDGNGGQTFYRRGEDDKVFALLKTKARYARERWGVSIFYVDTSVWVGGAPIAARIFEQLNKEFPDSLFIPEQETLDYLGHSIPFSDPKNALDAKRGPDSWRWAYPDGAITIKLSDCTGACWTANSSTFQEGQRNGDIALYNIPSQMNQTQLLLIEEMVRNEQQRKKETEERAAAAQAPPL